MQITEAGLELVKSFEGFRGTAYRCPAGVWTIGYGHTTSAGSPAVTPGLSVTEAEAARILSADLERTAGAVRRALTREVTDEQFSALVSFAYNVGAEAFRGSSVLKAVNAGDFEAVPRRLQLWVKGGGRVLPGLVKRRAAEAALFVKGSGGGEAAVASPRFPEAMRGKPVHRSTTVMSAVLAAFAALLSVLQGAAVDQAPASAGLAATVLAAAGWIIRERWLKAREEGV